MRYPRDYDTVPRLYFWLFPSAVAVSMERVLSRRGQTQFQPTTAREDALAGSVLDRLHSGVLHVFHHAGILFDALLSGARAAAGIGDGRRRRLDPLRHARSVRDLFIAAAAAVLTLYFLSWNLPTPGDISAALSAHPGAYKLSLGHMEDLTIASFAYLRLPLLAAAIAFLVGAAGTFRATGQRAFLATALMAIVFFQAARIAMADFDPYLSSRPLAEALLRAPARQLIVDHHYYTFSSVFFYTNRTMRCCSTAGSTIWCTVPTRPARRMSSSTTRNGKRCGCNRTATIW
jgi:hypothetical protein